MPRNTPQLAELLLQSRFHGSADQFRSRRPFSEDVEAIHAIVFNAKYDRQRKIRAYRGWLEKSQPAFSDELRQRIRTVFICLIEEDEILRMKRGDEDVTDTIQDHRQVWKRYALDGLHSSFILWRSKALSAGQPKIFWLPLWRKGHER